jgi:hypothetical protein
MPWYFQFLRSSSPKTIPLLTSTALCKLVAWLDSSLSTSSSISTINCAVLILRRKRKSEAKVNMCLFLGAGSRFGFPETKKDQNKIQKITRKTTNQYRLQGGLQQDEKLFDWTVRQEHRQEEQKVGFIEEKKQY